MEHLTLLPSLAGGVLIGLAASALLLFNGRIAGISGIAGGLFRPTRSDVLWRAAFIAGLIGGGLVLRAVQPSAFGEVATPSLAGTTIAGLLVGFGTRLGQGCTSGHGVCGLSRLSVRSIAATAIFMGAAMVTTFATHHLLRS